MMNTLTVRELIKELERYPDDMLVVAACDYGDRVHTMQAVRLSDVDEMALAKTDYSYSGYRVVYGHNEDAGQSVICLNADQIESDW